MEQPHLKPGHAAHDSAPGTTLSQDAVVVRGVRRQRGAFLLDVGELRIPTGYVTGLVGPNGSGKTTLIRTLLGLVTPESGDVAVLGSADVPGRRAAVGVVLDQITASPEWRAGSVGGRIGPLFSDWDEQRFQSLLDRFEVPGRNRVSELSRGQTVKLSCAMALAHDPRLLVLDEPSSGLDPVARRDLLDVIREFMLDPGHTVLFSTHITTDLDGLADHIVVMAGGTVAHQGMLDDIPDGFAVIHTHAPLSEDARAAVIGLHAGPNHDHRGLVRAEDTALFGPEVVMEPATTDDVVVCYAEHAKARAGSAHRTPSRPAAGATPIEEEPNA